MNRLLALIGRRTVMALVTLLVISALIFTGVEILPGDLAETVLGKDAEPETVAAFRKELKLDLPAHERYISWLQSFVQGDLGHSLASGRPVAELIGWRLKNSLFLAAVSALVAVPLAIILGMLSAVYRNTWFDRSLSITTLCTVSFPEYFIAYILVAVLSVHWNIFPVMANIYEQMGLAAKLKTVFLPAATLILVVLAHMLRMTRAAIINILTSPFIEMAYLKGLKKSRVIAVHAFPNVIAPVINVVALTLAYLVAGVVIVEVVFAYPGLGQLLVDSVAKRDLPVVQACGLIFAGIYVLLNLLADVLALVANPRMRNPR